MNKLQIQQRRRNLVLGEFELPAHTVLQSLRGVFTTIGIFLYLIALGVYLSVYNGGWHELPPLIMIGCVVVLVISEVVEYIFWRDRPPAQVIPPLLVTRFALIELVSIIDRLSVSPTLYYIIPIQIVYYYGLKAGYWAAGFMWLVELTGLSLFSRFNELGDFLEELFTWPTGLVFAIIFVRSTIRERISRAQTEHLLTELEESHHRLQEYARQSEELAASRERNRIAREIHDSLGHYLTAINVQLEKAMLLYQPDPKVAYETINDTKRMAGQALKEVRESVATLRQNSELFEFRPALIQLVAEIRAHNSFEIELNIEGSEKGFSSQTLLTLYRVAQEGLTNIRKYAQSRQVKLMVNFNEQDVTLSLGDDGKGFDVSSLQNLSPGRKGGYGLQGAKERLGMVGGHLEIESSSGKGTQLKVVAPKDPHALRSVEVNSHSVNHFTASGL
jgi:signal transduction histidine kinase